MQQTTIQNLKDIHLPQAISWWPLAPFWYFILLLITLILSWVTWRYIKRKHQLKYIIQAQHKLNQINKGPHNAAAAGEITYLLKQICIIYFPREQTAALQGTAWLEFLDDCIGFKDFTTHGSLLLTSAYQPAETTIDLIPIIKLTNDWLITLRRHIKKNKAR